MCVPYDDIVNNKAAWIKRIATFLNVPCPDDIVLEIERLTSKSWMLQNIDKFDESWVCERRIALGKVHPTIRHAAAKVTAAKIDYGGCDSKYLQHLHASKWAEHAAFSTGCASYEEMSERLCSIWTADGRRRISSL